MKMKKMIYLMLLFMVLGAAGAKAQVVIGSLSKNPDPSAVLDLNTGNSSNGYKGLLLPNVSLTGDKDVTTIPNPATGLLVYNTGAGGLIPAGMYWWDGVKEQWLSSIVPELLPQTISGLSAITKKAWDPAFALTATASSGLAVTYTSSNTAVATISGSTVTIVGAGASTLTANQAGNATYEPAPALTAVLTVNNYGSSTGQMGVNSYATYCYPNHLGCWTENSKEGDASFTAFKNQTAGERGYYYSSAVAATACSGDYALPTNAQWDALSTYLKSADASDEGTVFFKDAAALAGQMSETGVITGAYGTWGGFWSNPTPNAYYGSSGSKGFIAGSQAGYVISVRCVKSN
jgi:hypothetical protein